MSDTKRPLKVFLCHARDDKSKARELYRYLKKRGIQPWLDAENLLPGQNWQTEIPKAIETSDAIIICLSKSSVDKEGYVQKEIRFALDKALEMPEGRIFIIPARLDECEVPSSLKPFHWVDLFDGDDGYSKLMKSLKFRALQLERATVKLPKPEETSSNLPDEPKQTQQEGILVHVDGDVQGNILIGDQNAVQSPIVQVKPEKQADTKTPTIAEKKEPEKPRRKLRTAYIVAIIGAGATILATLIGILPQFIPFFPGNTPTPTVTLTKIITPTLTSIFSITNETPSLTVTPTLSLTPSPSLTKTPSPTLTPTVNSGGYFSCDARNIRLSNGENLARRACFCNKDTCNCQDYHYGGGDIDSWTRKRAGVEDYFSDLGGYCSVP